MALELDKAEFTIDVTELIELKNKLDLAWNSLTPRQKAIGKIMMVDAVKGAFSKIRRNATYFVGTSFSKS